MRYLNTTPHPITLQNADGTVFSVPPCGFLLNAEPKEIEMPHHYGIEIVKTYFRPTEEGLRWILAVRQEEPDAIIIGSMIAVQAYPGQVFGLVPVPGFERVPPDQKRMRADKFTVA